MADVVVFISYRRADTSADAGRLYDALRRRLGRENLFMDVDSIRPGEDWVEAVEGAVSKCDVLLALIGPDWGDALDDEGNRRLENDLDRVRLEIEAAFNAGKSVIPVLFERARMPHASELPESLHPLLRRHAIRISHASFESDLRGLLRALKTIEQRKEPGSTPAPPPPAPTAEPEPSPVPEPTLAELSPAAAAPPPPAAAPPIAEPLRPSTLGSAPPAPPPPQFYAWAPQGAYPGPTSPQGGGGGHGRTWLFVGAGAVGAVVLLALIGAFVGSPKATPTPAATTSATPSTPPGQTLAPTQEPTTPPTQEPTTPPTQEPTTPPTQEPTAGQLDYELEPNHGSTQLDMAFAPPPYQITFTTGGAIDVSYLMNDAAYMDPESPYGQNEVHDGECIGFASAAPDFRLDYRDPSPPPGSPPPFLWIYFVGPADIDTALVINDPDRNWFCDNNSLFEGGYDPWVSLDPLQDPPHSGQYDIWVTSLSGAPISGTLYISDAPEPQ